MEKNQELRKELERYGKVVADSTKFKTYTHHFFICQTDKQDRKPIVKELMKKFPEYTYELGADFFYGSYLMQYIKAFIDIPIEN